MTVNVEIRPYRPGDADALLAAAVESVDEISRWMPWCHPDYQRSDAEAWIGITIAARESSTMFDFAVLANGEFAGGCGLNNINWLDRVANLGYWVRTSASRQGVATKAARAVIDWAFAETALQRIEIVTAVGNSASQRVAEKLGATQDAVLRKRTVVNGAPSDAVLNSVVRPD